MDYLNISEIYPGAIIPLRYSKNVRAYARLIKPAGFETSFIFPNGVADDMVFVKCRWLIEWIHHKEIPKSNWMRKMLEWAYFYKTPLDPVTPRQMWDQRSMEGLKSHRDIVCKTGKRWDDYIACFGLEPEIKYYERGEERALPDSNIIF